MAALWAAIGLGSGLAYRELTRAMQYTGPTQLSVVHTHVLVLGTVVGLVLMALERLYRCSRDRRFTWMLWLWNGGLALTAAGLAVRGTLQVLGAAAADSPALAGASGLGHMVITAAFVLLFLVLGRRIRLDATDPAASASPVPA
jgi:hypothetical protein